MPSIERVKIYGERNTGTNFLQKLIAGNFETEMISQRVGKQRDIKKIRKKFKHLTDASFRYAITEIAINRYHELHVRKTLRGNAGWKHMYPPVGLIKRSPKWRENTLFVIVVKHPVFWALSFKKRGYHNYFKTGDMDVSQFLRHVFIPASIDNVSALTYESIVDLYADKIDGYRKLSELGVPCELVRYEALIADLPGFLDRLSSKFGLKKKKDVYAIPQKSTKGTDDRQLGEFQKDYALERVKEIVSPEDFEFIMSRFGQERLAWLGYPP